MFIWVYTKLLLKVFLIRDCDNTLFLFLCAKCHGIPIILSSYFLQFQIFSSTPVSDSLLPLISLPPASPLMQSADYTVVKI